MKYVKFFEDYINDPANRVQTMLGNMVKMIKASFDGENNILGEKELGVVSLIEIQQSTSNDSTEKNIVFNFRDDLWYYQVIFVIKLEDVKKENPISKGYIKIKIYDGQNGDKFEECQSNLDIHESTSDERDEEGRYFVKVKEVEPTSTPEGEEAPETQPSSEGMDFIENYIINKAAKLKEPFEKKLEQ